MSETESEKYCVEYLLRRGVPESDAEGYSRVALCALRTNPRGGTLRQACELILSVLAACGVR